MHCFSQSISLRRIFRMVWLGLRRDLLPYLGEQHQGSGRVPFDWVR